MDRSVIFENFLIRDFAEICKEMYYLEFLSFCKEILDKLEKLDLSPKGFYYDKKDTIKKLYQFVKGTEYYVRTDGNAPIGASYSDLAFMETILSAMKKRQGLG